MEEWFPFCGTIWKNHSANRGYYLSDRQLDRHLHGMDGMLARLHEARDATEKRARDILGQN